MILAGLHQALPYRVSGAVRRIHDPACSLVLLLPLSRKQSHGYGMLNTSVPSMIVGRPKFEIQSVFEHTAHATRVFPDTSRMAFVSGFAIEIMRIMDIMYPSR